MKVAVFGLGYVGSVSAASFAADEHDIVGVDVNPGKVSAVNGGRTKTSEELAKEQEKRLQEMRARLLTQDARVD